MCDSSGSESNELLLFESEGPIRFIFFFFNDTATTEIYTLSLHDALPICNDDSYCNVNNDNVSDVAHEQPRSVNHTSQSESSRRNTSEDICLVHNKPHQTIKCKAFLAMKVQDRIRVIRKGHACYRCLGKHDIKTCSSKSTCDHCKMSNHHALLCRKHAAEPIETKTSSHSGVQVASNATSKHGSCPAVLCIQQVPVVSSNNGAMVFFDIDPMVHS